jgi:hypothetical protein
VRGFSRTDPDAQFQAEGHTIALHLGRRPLHRNSAGDRVDGARLKRDHHAVAGGFHHRAAVFTCFARERAEKRPAHFVVRVVTQRPQKLRGADKVAEQKSDDCRLGHWRYRPSLVDASHAALCVQRIIDRRSTQPDIVTTAVVARAWGHLNDVR